MKGHQKSVSLPRKLESAVAPRTSPLSMTQASLQMRRQPASQGSRPQPGPRPTVGASLSPTASNRRVLSRQVSASNSKAPNYLVHAPIHVTGRDQQLRATISGTPQVAGSIDISSAGAGKVFISNLKVDQQHRRRGVAGKLIDAAVNAARRQGFKTASLEARPSDNGISPQALVAMYRRQGFKSVGKTGRGSPLMERKL
jgi:GNAT superfamily N-acetyltransferase